MKIKRIMCVILSSVMLLCAPNAVSAVETSAEATSAGLGSVKETTTEAERVGVQMIYNFELTGEEAGTRLGYFTGLTQCDRVCDICGFKSIRIEKLYTNGWGTFDTVYGDDLEYDVSSCSFSHYYSFPIGGHYRIYAYHYAQDGNLFTGGQITDRIPNVCSSFFVL